jgi:hypothetical protein
MFQTIQIFVECNLQNIIYGNDSTKVVWLCKSNLVFYNCISNRQSWDYSKDLNSLKHNNNKFPKALLNIHVGMCLKSQGPYVQVSFYHIKSSLKKCFINFRLFQIQTTVYLIGNLETIASHLGFFDWIPKMLSWAYGYNKHLNILIQNSNALFSCLKMI